MIFLSFMVMINANWPLINNLYAGGDQDQVYPPTQLTQQKSAGGGIFSFFYSAWEKYRATKTQKKMQFEFIKAINEYDIEKIKQLISEGLDINFTFNDPPPTDFPGYEKTPLILATQLGRTRIVEILIENGADTNAQTKDGKSALYFAMARDYYPIFKALIDAGADINLENNFYGSYTQMAISKDLSPDYLEYLLKKGADPNKPGPQSPSPLIAAATHRDYQKIKLLLENGANPNFQDRAGQTVLMIAAHFYHNETLFDHLITPDTDLNIRDQNGNTALMITLLDQNYPTALRLLKSGADPNLQNHDGISPLMQVILQNEGNKLAQIPILETVIDKLIEKSADLNLKDKNGDSVLFHAIRSKQEEMALHLISMGASPHVTNNKNLTPLMMASGQGLSELARKLIELGVDVNSIDSNGNTALFYAIRSRNIEIVKLLIGNGALLDHRNGAGQTPLNYSSQLIGALDISKFLVSQNVDVNIPDKNGKTSLHNAIILKDPELTEHLCENGADINQKDHMGRTPLTTAIEYGMPEFAVRLIRLGAKINPEKLPSLTPHKYLQHPELTLFMLKNHPDFFHQKELRIIDLTDALISLDHPEYWSLIDYKTAENLNKTINELMKRNFFPFYLDLIPKLKGLKSKLFSDPRFFSGGRVGALSMAPIAGGELELSPLKASDIVDKELSPDFDSPDFKSALAEVSQLEDLDKKHSVEWEVAEKEVDHFLERPILQPGKDPENTSPKGKNGPLINNPHCKIVSRMKASQ